MAIPININELLSGKIVEFERIEFKKGWNPTDIMHTVCAFANDFENLGSGYIIAGIEEDAGILKRPVHGFPTESFDKVQREMLGYCNLMNPPYFPHLSIEEFEGKHILVIWVPAGSNRPYEVPKDVTSKHKIYEYYIRQYSNTVKANKEQRLELISLTANVPFDDRFNRNAKIEDLSLTLIQKHLYETKSKLYQDVSKLSITELCKQMNLSEGAAEHLYPKNIALLMFCDKPELFFPRIQIDIVEFPKGVASDEFYEKSFTGAIQNQLREALSYIKNNIIKEKVIKLKNEAESIRFFNYPYQAIEEALANAVYHRNYEINEPIEIRVLPNSIEIINQGGVDPSIRPDDFSKGIIKSRRYRNRRVGEFLKELRLTEGRGTGIPTIINELKKNGSPEPKFDTDGDRRQFFIIELAAHSEFTTQESDQESNQESNQESVKESVKVSVEVSDQILKILEYCIKPHSKKDILFYIGLINHTKNYNKHIAPGLKLGLIELTIPDNPKNRNQKYKTTLKGQELLKINKEQK